MFRKDSNFYSRVDKKMEGNWKILFFCIFIINIVSIVVDKGSFSLEIIEFLKEVIYSGFSIDKFSKIIIEEHSFDFVHILISLATNLFTITLNMVLLDFIRTGKFEIKNILNYVKEYPIQTVGASIIFYLLHVIFGYIPIIGAIINYILHFGFSYVYYLILINPKENPINLFLKSWKLTDGNKMELFHKVIHYFKIAWYGYGISAVGFLIVLFATYKSHQMNFIGGFGIFTIIFGFAWLIFWKIKNTPHYYLACALYFKEHMEYKNIKV